MDNLSRYYPAAFLAVGCVLIFGVREQQQVPPRAPMSTLQLDVPAGYGSQNIEVPPEERRVAGMSDYVMRAYQRDSLDLGFSVYVGYYDFQQQGKSIHSPKNCLPGAGWEQVNASTPVVSVPGGPSVTVNRYLLANKGAQALVYYWYQGRGRIESSEYRVKWNLMRDAALYGRTEEALVRLVMPVDTRGDRATIEARYRAADSLAVGLAQQLVPRVARVLPPSPAA
jgi:EpsI family protein